MEEEGVSASTAASLRAEVRRFVTGSGTRRALPAIVNLGALDGVRLQVLPDTSYDAGLRADLLTRALDRTRAPGQVDVWLTRGGFPSAADLDLAWCAAAELAFGRHGVPMVPFYVITRHGWLEVRTGQSRTWGRVRPAPRGTG